MYTGSDLRHVAVMAMVGPFADLHVVSVADADRLPVSEREKQPLVVNRRISTFPRVYSAVVKPEVVFEVSL